MTAKENFFDFPEVRLPEKEKGPYQFLLGYLDREMMMIEELLRKCRQPYKWAQKGGNLTTPRTCYEADPVVVLDKHIMVLVECLPTTLLGFRGVPKSIDHHEKGHPGFEFPAEKYWQGSSLGQAWTLLRRKHKLKKPGKAHLIAAARDHCRFAAARGECPGVTPEEVALVGRRWIVDELNLHKRDPESRVTRNELDSEIKRLTRAIDKSPVISVGNQEVADLRRVAVPTIYSLEFFAIYEALADLSCAALIRTGNTPDENDKLVLMGDLVPSTVRHFKEAWAPQQGMTGIYGCEVRGYAGGYIPHSLAKVA